MRSVLIATALLLMVAAVGCQRAFVDTPNPSPIASEAYDRTFDASIAVLRDHGFDVDRQDYRFGRVTTMPKDSPTAFEPWHGDNTTAAQAWQSTLDHQRRTVSLFFEPTDEPGDAEANAEADHVIVMAEGDYLLRVEVLLERRVQPTRRMTGRTRGNVFRTLDDVPAEWARRGIDRSYWEPVGRDAYMEGRLLAEIVARGVDGKPTP
ncbi:hypothetical protein ACERK3_18385 [Phycisphaerales bacterium AB-hyl4]|uniref:Lipoprotein n=1 Tax=Natronomicrosphaera hydrolytica TaxID=3242702 RepID=A0ABV4U9G5_9BACT